MFRILVVEDDNDKLRDILRALSGLDGFHVDDIESVADANSAKLKMREKHFDLLILDISIPQRKTSKAELDGGLVLLEEVLARELYHTPVHIIGLTAYKESFIRAKSQLEKNVLTVIQYSIKSDDWREHLISGVNQRVSAKDAESKTQPDYNYDIAIICALESELRANLSNGWLWNKLPLNHDDTNYFESSFINSDSRKIRIVAAAAIRMGMPSSTALASKMITSFRPKILAMTGIMAGVSDRVKISDLVLSHPVWDWGSGKWVTQAKNPLLPISLENSESVFQPEPFQFSVDTKIIKVLDQIADDKQYLYNIRASYKGPGSLTTDINIHKGAVASGASVLSDKATFNSVKGQHRKLLGVEMEAYGMFSAVESASHPKPLPLCIKAVVDYGDLDKGDDHQEYGAYLSAQVVKRLLENLNYLGS
jgi:nucleoside phosphorylase/ActR/RegA family two-component response regulator